MQMNLLSQDLLRKAKYFMLVFWQKQYFFQNHFIHLTTPEKKFRVVNFELVDTLWLVFQKCATTVFLIYEFAFTL